MPHTTIEYSANVAEHHDIAALVGAIHQAALETGIARVAGVRTRAVALDHYQVADGSEDLAMIAIAVRLGPGREAAVKTALNEAILNAAEAQFATETSPLAIAWSIELNEINADFRTNRNYVADRLAARERAN